MKKEQKQKEDLQMIYSPYRYTMVPTSIFCGMDLYCRSVFYTLLETDIYQKSLNNYNGWSFITDNDLISNSKISKKCVINNVLDVLLKKGIIDFYFKKNEATKSTCKYFKINYDAFCDYDNINYEKYLNPYCISIESQKTINHPWNTEECCEEKPASSFVDITPLILQTKKEKKEIKKKQDSLNNQLKEFSCKLVLHQTKAEREFGKVLRQHKIKHFKQKEFALDIGHGLVKGYIADFFIPDKKIIIEIDGEYHECDDRVKYDKIRDDAFKKIGIETIRIKNEEVFKPQKVDKIIEQIIMK